MAHKSDSQLIRETRNSAYFFVEQRHVAWVLFAGVVIWGIYSYFNMPKRKDPYDPVRDVIAIGRWPGMPTEKVEQFVTKKIEQSLAQNPSVEEVRSTTRPGEAVVFVRIKELNGLDNLKFLENADRQYNDIKIRLDNIRDLPAGVLPLEFYKDFADTATLVLTVSSPHTSEVENSLRARDIEASIRATRSGQSSRTTLVLCYPMSINPSNMRRNIARLKDFWKATGIVSDARVIDLPGFFAVDAKTERSDSDLLSSFRDFEESSHEDGDLGPELWDPIIVRDLSGVQDRLNAIAEDKYSYRELDDYSDQLEKGLKSLSQVSRVTRFGVLPQQINLEFSQERLVAHSIPFTSVEQALQQHSTALANTSLNEGGDRLQIAPSGAFDNVNEIADTVLKAEPGHVPVYMRDVVDVQRGYTSPASYLNFYSAPDNDGKWTRHARAITLDIQMVPGVPISQFNDAVNKRLAELKLVMPVDLVINTTSSEPAQVKDNVNLFMESLWESVLLVVIVAFVGFRDWRSALLLAIAIPLTLAMTFGMMNVLGIDLQQTSIATLIIALGLLVDDPVVAGDAIKRELAAGYPLRTAAWLGPTKLGRAILFATITNVVAYLPFLLLDGDQWMFLYSLPVVITCSLIASRVVSMTFVPLLGSYILKRPELPDGSDINSGRARLQSNYLKIVGWSVDHRWAVLGGFCALFVLGGFFASQLKQQFFPKDLLDIAYADVWLPENASLQATMRATQASEKVIQDTADKYTAERFGPQRGTKSVLASLTSWIGGAGPRYWFTLNPEPKALNYAHILIQTTDKQETRFLVPKLQEALSAQIPDARIDVHELEVGPPVGVPIAIRISGSDIAQIRSYADQIKMILYSIPTAQRIRDDWGPDAIDLKLNASPDRANLSGITNQDIAFSSSTGFNGHQVSVLREGDKEIPIVVRLREGERTSLQDLNNLYVFSQQSGTSVPIKQVADISFDVHPAVIHRVNQFRTITVGAFPSPGVLPSEVLGAAMPQIRQLENQLPPGMHIELAGEYKESAKANKRQAKVLTISVLCILLVLVIQLRHAVKPLIVFSVLPFGMVGAFAALYIMHAPFGFMAFLGCTSLIGVIVSHIILLFDCVEEQREHGSTLREALLNAGVLRLRPVLITSAATVIAFVPLALHGGPLWQPLCYTQIGGLILSTAITLILVPAIYTIFVRDLKWVQWEMNSNQSESLRGVLEPDLLFEKVAR
jgi:multidrug efflux pump subunit AcrB